MTPSTPEPAPLELGELLPVFAIHAELVRNADQAALDAFGAQVETGIRVAAALGSLDRLNGTLRMWLTIALCTRDLKRGFGELDEARQRARGEYLVEKWLKTHDS